MTNGQKFLNRYTIHGISCYDVEPVVSSYLPHVGLEQDDDVRHASS